MSLFKALKNIEETVEEALHHLPNDVLILLRDKNLIKDLLRKMLIEQHVETTELSKTVEKDALARFYEQRKLNSTKNLKRYLLNQGINEKILFKQAIIPLKVKHFSMENFGNKAEAHFLKRKESLDLFTYSLLRVKDPNLAYELYLQIEAAETDFFAIANQHSEGKERFSGGLVGPTNLVKVHPLLRKQLEESSIGALKEPINIESFWIVTRLEEHLSAKFDLPMKQRMSIELFDSLVEQQSNEIIKNIKFNTVDNGVLE